MPPPEVGPGSDIPDSAAGQHTQLLATVLKTVKEQLSGLDEKVERIDVKVGNLEISLKVSQESQRQQIGINGGLRSTVAVLQESRRLRLWALGIAGAGLMTIVAALVGAWARSVLAKF